MSGIVDVSFKSPSLKCKYKVVLFVNPYIDNMEDCKKYEFKKDNHAEIHSVVKTICPKYDNESDGRELETVQSASDCKVNILYHSSYTLLPH